MPTLAELKAQAKKRTEESQAKLAAERVAKAKEEAARQAAKHAQEREENERQRRLFAARVEQRNHEEAELRARKLREKELESKPAGAIVSQTTAKMRPSGSSQLGGQKMPSTQKLKRISGLTPKSSRGSSSALPLTRAEKRARKERMMLNDTKRLGRQPNPALPHPNLSRNNNNNNNPVPHKTNSSTDMSGHNERPGVGESTNRFKTTTKRSLATIETELEHIRKLAFQASSSTSSNSNESLRHTSLQSKRKTNEERRVQELEAELRTRRREIAMDEKRNRERICAGDSGVSHELRSQDAMLNQPGRRETPRERFLREELARKAARKSDPQRSLEYVEESENERTAEEDMDSYESEGIDNDENEDQNISEQIWKLFGKDRKKYANVQVDSDDDMEADAASVFREDIRSARQGREDDLQEEELEREHARKKAKRRKAV